MHLPLNRDPRIRKVLEASKPRIQEEMVSKTDDEVHLKINSKCKIKTRHKKATSYLMIMQVLEKALGSLMEMTVPTLVTILYLCYIIGYLVKFPRK